MTVYGYARVSTIGQDLEAQIQQLEQNGASTIYQEKFTGTKTDRPQFNELLSVLEAGDTLMVTKLDRFARSAWQGSKLVKELVERGIKVHILNIGLLDNTPASKLIKNIFLAFAEFERDMIVERTQEGKAIAKQQEDFKEGRPKKYNQYQLDEAMKLLETMSFAQVEKEMHRRGTKISMSTLKREAKKRKAEKLAQEF
ncbi:recombinase family protein [Lysinibacillus capsici]|uniref:recombinase family protein n=1 Tax=Lysinibacillus capsici TaxID=2115968 RepID=UPI002E1B7B5C|nr:recombinase family protein [Lysinibacillus capsici]